MTIWCVRADSGNYADNFRNGGYVAVDYGIAEPLPIGENEAYEPIYRKYNPGADQHSVGQNTGQIFRFGEKIQPGDYVITPLSPDTDQLHYGKVAGPYYFEENSDDGCEYRHRRDVEWREDPLLRSAFSQEFRDFVHAARRTITEVPHVHFLEYLMH